MRKISIASRKTILSKLLKGETQSSLARKYGVRKSTIGHISHASGIFRQPENLYLKIWDSDSIDKFLVQSGSTVRRAGASSRHVKVPSEWFCLRCGHRWKSTFDTVRRIKIGCSQCGYGPSSMNYDILDRPTYHACFFLGAFYARGIIAYSKQGNRVGFSILGSPEQMDVVKNIIASDHSLTKKTGLRCFSRKVAGQLHKIVDRERIPDFVSDSMIPAFVLGYLLMSGSAEYGVDCGRNHNLTMRITIRGGEKMMHRISDEFAKFAGYGADGYVRCVRKQGKNKRRGGWEFSITGLKAPHVFLRWVASNPWNTPLLGLHGRMRDFAAYLADVRSGLLVKKSGKIAVLKKASKDYWKLRVLSKRHKVKHPQTPSDMRRKLRKSADHVVLAAARKTGMRWSSVKAYFYAIRHELLGSPPRMYAAKRKAIKYGEAECTI